MIQKDKKSIQKIKHFLQFRKSLITELNQLKAYGQKIEEVRKKYDLHEKS